MHISRLEIGYAHEEVGSGSSMDMTRQGSDGMPRQSAISSTLPVPAMNSLRSPQRFYRIEREPIHVELLF